MATKYLQQKFPVKFTESSPHMVTFLRKRIKNDVKTNENGLPSFKKYNQFTICLPPLHVYPDPFRQQYYIQVCDLDMKHDLKTAKIINWCSSVKSLYPVKTTADGNCLLHAISQALWGIEDDHLFLRKLLYVKIASESSDIRKRWQYHQEQLTRNRPQEFVYHNTSLEISREWESVVTAAKDLPRQDSTGLPYYSLEGIHMYAMANILARPIIVLGKERVHSAFGESMQENSLYGIYLPLELDSHNTCRCPIIIGYNQNHFAPLVTHSNTPDGKGAGQNVLPLVMSDASPLPVRFVLQQEERSIQELIKKYMKTKSIPYSTPSSITTIPAVITDYLTIYDREDIVSEHRRLCEQIFAETDPTATFVPGRFSGKWTVQQQDLYGSQSHTNNKQLESRQCLTEGCKMFGSSETGYMCSDCFRKYTIDYNRQEAEQKGYHMRSEPSAPPLSTPYETNNYMDISMIGENCHNNCGNRCSVNTYPYCHECWPKFNQVQPQEEALASMNLAQGTENILSESENRGGIEEQALFGMGRNDATLAGGAVGGVIRKKEKEDQRLLIPNMPHTQFETENTEEKRQSLESTPLPSMPSMVSSSETYPLPRSISKSLSSEGTPSPGHGNAVVFSSQQLQLNDLNQGLNPEAQREVNNETEREAVSSTVEQSPPETSELNKRLCAKAGCRGLRLHNNYGYCLECWDACFGGRPEANASTIESRVSLSTQEINDINPVVTSSKQKVICTSPVCNNKVYPPHKLCPDCIKILNDAYNARSRSAEGHLRLTEERRTLSYSPPRTRCKKPGCTYTGNSRFEGFCSACYREDQIAKAAAAIRPLPTLSNAIPYRAASSLCVEPGCDRYGDPNMFARCTEHFRKIVGIGYNPEPLPGLRRYMTRQEVEIANVGERQPAGPTSLHYRPPVDSNTATRQETVHQNQRPRQTRQREQTHNSPFETAMTNVERQMKSPSLCKTRGCTNFGNVRNKGYCNSCYKWKQTHDQALGHSGEFEEHTCC